MGKIDIMGMFDEITCSAKLPGTRAKFIEPGHVFQTKSLDCTLDRYEITADGRLFLDGKDCEFHGAVEFYTDNIAATDYDGEVTVYWTATGDDAEIVTYTALFSVGKLLEIREQRERFPALPIARRPPTRWSRRPAPDEIAAWKARAGESLLGRTVFVLWGGRPIEDGYEGVVIAESDHGLVIKTGKEFEVLNRCARDRTFFDSREAAVESREADQKEYQQRQQQLRQVLEAETEAKP